VELALQAAFNNCHLFIEKPLSHTLDGIEDLLRTTQQQDLVTMVGCNMRFHPGPMQVKAWLDEGAVGSVLAARIRTGSYLPSWRPQQDYHRSYSASPHWGGAVLDCIHELDLALWLLGEATLARSLTRPAHSLGLETDGLAELVLEHTSGAISNVHLNFVQRNYRRSIEIVGSEGTIEWDYSAGCVDLYGPDGDLSVRVAHPTGWETNQMYVDEIDYFLEHARSGTASCNPIGSAARTLQLALAARTL
jgi:predicted dehydrogenase